MFAGRILSTRKISKCTSNVVSTVVVGLCGPFGIAIFPSLNKRLILNMDNELILNPLDKRDIIFS